MAALDYITIEGFKSIRKVERLDLRPINIIVGPNGSGKSNFIGAFAFLHAIREGRLQDYVAKAGGAEKIIHFGSKTTEQVHFRISFNDEVNQYEINLAPTSQDTLSIGREVVYFWDKSAYTGPVGRFPSKVGSEAGISATSQSGIASYVRSHLDRWRLYHFHDTSTSSPMKRTAEVNDNRFLRPDASNLAAFLYILRLKHQSEYSLIRRAVQRVAPFFEDFQLEPLRLNPNTIRLEWRHKGSDQYFDAASLSDGTLRFIALATLLLQPANLSPSVVLIDEPELGLHPFAITMLAALIKQSSTRTQVIASTQSPILLDHFEPEDVLVADRVDGGTTLARLESAPLEAWLHEYSLGQLWEKNEFGGRPRAEV